MVARWFSRQGTGVERGGRRELEIAGFGAPVGVAARGTGPRAVFKNAQEARGVLKIPSRVAVARSEKIARSSSRAALRLQNLRASVRGERASVR